MSYRIICHVMSYRVISYIMSYIASYHVISYHIVSYHIIYMSYIVSYHVMSYFIIYHVMSYRVISYIMSYIVSYHVISYRIISYHVMSYRVISYHISCHISYHIMSCHVIVSYHIIAYHSNSYHVMSCHVMSYRIISYIQCHIIYIMSYHIKYHVISYHIITYHIMSFHVKSYHITYSIYHIMSYHISYHVMSYHITSYIMSCHVMSCHIISIAATDTAAYTRITKRSPRGQDVLLSTFQMQNWPAPKLVTICNQKTGSRAELKRNRRRKARVKFTSRVETKTEQKGKWQFVGSGDKCDNSIETTLGLMSFHSLPDIGTQKLSTANKKARRTMQLSASSKHVIFPSDIQHVNSSLQNDMKAQKGLELYLYRFFNLGSRRYWLSTSRTDRFNPSAWSDEHCSS